MELAKVNVPGLLIDHVIVKAPPVDRYEVKDGFVTGTPLKESERRDLEPVSSTQLEGALVSFQRVGRNPNEKAILRFVHSYGLPLSGDCNKQPFQKIVEEALNVRELLLRYKRTREEIGDEKRRYVAAADIAYSIVGKLEGVRLHLWGLRQDWDIADTHHALGLTVEPALFCPDLISYIYLQLYMITTFRQPVQECKGCGIIFSPQRRNANFCNMKCYKAYWKRTRERGEKNGKKT